jgi:hypothetical protein
MPRERGGECAGRIVSRELDPQHAHRVDHQFPVGTCQQVQILDFHTR